MRAGFVALLSTFILLALLAHPAHSAERPTLAGVWNVGPLVERWNVGDWGKACGPQPTAHELPGGQVTIRVEGNELVISGLGRTFRTDECWEQLPGVDRSSHSAADYAWRTRCTSAPKDPRQTLLVTTITATDNALSLDETGEYQFRIEGQNCTASARRQRNFALVLREGEKAPTAATTPPALQPQPTAIATPQPRAEPVPLTAPAPRPVPEGRCSRPGDPVRLEVRPARKLLKPSDRFTFRAIALDAAGCVTEARITWAIVTPNAKLTVGPGGVVTVGEEAADGTVELAVSFAGRQMPVFVDIATASRYDALLSATNVDAAAEETATLVDSSRLGAHSAEARDGAHSRKTTFVVIVGALALLLATLGFVLLRRTAGGTSPVTPEGAPDQAAPAPTAARPEGVFISQGRPAAARSMVCPSCRSEFPAGSTFCPHDGNRLMAPPTVDPLSGPSATAAGGICPTCGRGYDPGVKSCPVHGDDLVPAAVYRATADRRGSTERGKICPSCGGRYGGQAAFCGKDGTLLVLVN